MRISFKALFNRIVQSDKEFWIKVKSELKHKQKFVVMDSDTYREKFSFQLSALNLFVTIGIASITLVLITALLIIFTPLREYIPGYAHLDLIRQSNQNEYKIDSLATIIQQQEKMLSNIKMVVMGEPIPSVDFNTQADTHKVVGTTTYIRSKEDSLLRLQNEQEDIYQVSEQEKTPQKSISKGFHTLKSYYFFCPMRGDVIQQFSIKERHYGIDVAGIENASIKSVYAGTVLFANWTLETGYTLAIQHPGNIISVYKHCSSLLRKSGDIVRPGEVIGFIGNSGELTTGVHLHFELWYNGNPVNPFEYITF